MFAAGIAEFGSPGVNAAPNTIVLPLTLAGWGMVGGGIALLAERALTTRSVARYVAFSVGMAGSSLGCVLTKYPPPEYQIAYTCLRAALLCRKVLDTGASQRMEIEILYLEGCPNFGPTLDLVREAVSETNITATVRSLPINGLGEAAEHRFLGSPSVQIDGLDIEPSRRGDGPFYGCRLYRSRESMSGTPPLEMIREALISASKERREPGKT